MKISLTLPEPFPGTSHTEVDLEFDKIVSIEPHLIKPTEITTIMFLRDTSGGFEWRLDVTETPEQVIDLI